jgi:hypothetical protein
MREKTPQIGGARPREHLLPPEGKRHGEQQQQQQAKNRLLFVCVCLTAGGAAVEGK